MPAVKLLNLIAVTTLAILACSFAPSPVTAVAIENAHLTSRGHNHVALAKKRRANGSKRCKPRPSSSPAGKPASTAKPPSTTVKPAPASTSKAPTGDSNPSGGSNNSGGNTGSGDGTRKVGLAWVDGGDAALANFKTPEVRYIMTWSPYLPKAAKALGFEPLPMLWGTKQIAQFKSLVVKGYATTALGFNEPDQGGQSNLSPQYAAELWTEHMEPLTREGYQLISPACTNAPAGKKWMQDFMAACKGCTFNGIATHFYGTDPQAMIAHLQDLHNTFNLPIWATEFACHNFGSQNGGLQCNENQVWNFMKTVKSFMDNTPWVTAYFAFGALHDMRDVNPLNQLLAPNGQPTALGAYYIS